MKIETLSDSFSGLGLIEQRLGEYETRSRRKALRRSLVLMGYWALALGALISLPLSAYLRNLCFRKFVVLFCLWLATTVMLWLLSSSLGSVRRNGALAGLLLMILQTSLFWPTPTTSWFVNGQLHSLVPAVALPLYTSASPITVHFRAADYTALNLYYGFKNERDIKLHARIEYDLVCLPITSAGAQKLLPGGELEHLEALLQDQIRQALGASIERAAQEADKETAQEKGNLYSETQILGSVRDAFPDLNIFGTIHVRECELTLGGPPPQLGLF
ncbi:MAG: hypothetical protein U0517_02525 [Candidatus Andersenbacteria bacterium]